MNGGKCGNSEIPINNGIRKIAIEIAGNIIPSHKQFFALLGSSFFMFLISCKSKVVRSLISGFSSTVWP